MRKPAALALAALAVISVACGLADPPRKRSNSIRTVSYANLDLNTRAGVATLYRRLSAAAVSVCRDLYTIDASRQNCVRDSLTRAVRDVDAPGLTAYAAERLGEHKERPTALFTAVDPYLHRH